MRTSQLLFMTRSVSRKALHHLKRLSVEYYCPDIKMLAFSRLIRSAPASLLRSSSQIGYFSTSSIISQSLNFQAPPSFQKEVKSLIQDASRNTLKREDSRKTFLVDMYNYFYNQNQIVLFCHFNNLTKVESKAVTQRLSPLGAQMRVLNANVFKYFLRASFHKDPASKAAARKVKKLKIRHPLEAALHGPTCMILLKDLDPQNLEKVLNVISKQNERLFVVAAKVGNEMFDVEKINEFKQLPSLSQLHGQLTGVLQLLSGSGLVSTLSQHSNMLFYLLKSVEQDSNNSEK